MRGRSARGPAAGATQAPVAQAPPSRAALLLRFAALVPRGAEFRRCARAAGASLASLAHPARARPSSRRRTLLPSRSENRHFVPSHGFASSASARAAVSSILHGASLPAAPPRPPPRYARTRCDTESVPEGRFTFRRMDSTTPVRGVV
jgi:hypothetical protein